MLELLLEVGSALLLPALFLSPFIAAMHFRQRNRHWARLAFQMKLGYSNISGTIRPVNKLSGHLDDKPFDIIVHRTAMGELFWKPLQKTSLRLATGDLLDKLETEMPIHQTGDMAFDQTFTIHTNNPDELAFLNPQVRRSLTNLAHQTDGVFLSSGALCWKTKPSAIRQKEALVELLDLQRDLIHALEYVQRGSSFPIQNHDPQIAAVEHQNARVFQPTKP